jgi:hypothetical protein
MYDQKLECGAGAAKTHTKETKQVPVPSTASKKPATRGLSLAGPKQHSQKQLPIPPALKPEHSDSTACVINGKAFFPLREHTPST